MSDPLATYLHDHLAGSRIALDLLGALAEEHGGEPLGAFAEELRVEIDEDRQTLEDLSALAGPGGTSIKDGLAWLAEKAARVKLRRDAGHGLGTLEALETVALGILGKRALWRALAHVAGADSRLQGPDYGQLIARAEAQFARVDERRLAVAREVLPGKR
jgi:hypothetical protein